MYEKLKSELKSLFENERDIIANASNFSSFIYHNLASVNWAGFYFLNDGELILGPFQGKPACIRIQSGKGVCGAAAVKRETIVVPNVHDFDGHIACDSQSNSEIVIPLIFKNNLYGVFDIDSPAFDRFTEEDRIGLEELTGIFINSSDITRLKKYY